MPDAPAGAPAGEEARRDGLAAVSVAERSLSAEAAQWLSLALVTVAAVVADQVTKHIVSSQLALDEEVAVIGPFSIHHVQNSGIAFGLFPDATAAVIVLTTVAVGWMLVFFARAGAAIPCCPWRSGSSSAAASRTRRPRAAGPRHGLPRPSLLARLQPRGRLHRRGRRAPRRDDARGRAKPAPAARRVDAPLLIALRVPEAAAGLRLDRFLAEQSAGGLARRRGAARRSRERCSSTASPAEEPPARRWRGGSLRAPGSCAPSPEPEAEPAGLAIAWEDEHLLVVDKPAGVVVHPGAGHARGTLAGALRGRGATGGPTSARASSTASTAIRRACSSSLARRGLRPIAEPRSAARPRTRVPRARSGPASLPAGADRGAHRP